MGFNTFKNIQITFYLCFFMSLDCMVQKQYTGTKLSLGNAYMHEKSELCID